MPKKSKRAPRAKDPVTGKFIAADGTNNSKALTNIDVDDLPTRIMSAEQIRGYTLKKSKNGKMIVDRYVRLFMSDNTPPAVIEKLGKSLLGLMIPDSKQVMEIGMGSADGQTYFRLAQNMEETE